MIEITDEQMKELQRLCREFGVVRLDLFGSAATDDFDPERSDVDFVVQFEDTGWKGAFNRFFEFKAALEEAFGRHVDLVVVKAIRNSYFRRAMEESRKDLYAA